MTKNDPADSMMKKFMTAKGDAAIDLFVLALLARLPQQRDGVIAEVVEKIRADFDADLAARFERAVHKRLFDLAEERQD